MMSLVTPILIHNVKNANDELKRMNEVLFKALLSSFGQSLFEYFDNETSLEIQKIIN
jgi:hypothetical protein